MNRADQAPEPSMEELLASIRLIISDADRKGAPHPGVPGAEAAHAGAVAGDDVFDLTDELVFPETQAAPLSPSAAATRRALGAPGELAGLEAHTASRRVAPVTAGILPAGGQRRTDAPPTLRADTQKQALPPVTRPIWSGRELPSPAATSHVAAAKPREEGIAAKPQARNWAGDIQLPVPDQGPVSLFSTHAGNLPSREESADDAGDRAFGIAASAAGAGQDSGEGSAAVAVLAQRLARSAIGVLEASELESANHVDFEHLDAESRAEVMEKFADVIERESAELDTPGQSARPDAVTGQARRTGQPEHAAEEYTAFETPAGTSETPAIPEAVRLPKLEVRPETAAEPERPTETRRPPAPESPAQIEGWPAPANSPANRPLAQAQFVGPAQMPVPTQAGRTLEDAVREMLRPLLVQWLNENMPRILENAIREEIAVRGLLPNSGS